jgi:hypothetical protein
MQDMIICFAVFGAIFVPIIVSSLIRRGIARWRLAKAKPANRVRKPLLPSNAWCSPARTAGEDWRN